MDTALPNGVAQGPQPPVSRRALWLAELRAIGALAIPVVIQTSAQQGMIVTDQVFLGHLGTAELAAAALANAYTNLMWFFLLGFATALDTLGSHAYGAGDHRALVIWCVAAFLLTTVLVVPISVGMALGRAAGRALFGQDDHTAALMGRFCDGLIPGMWPLMWGTVLAKYLQVQNNMLAPSLIAVATFLLNIGFNAVLVRSLGFPGGPMATTLSRWAQCILLAAAVALHERARGRRLRLASRKARPRRARPLGASADGGAADDSQALLASREVSMTAAAVFGAASAEGSRGRRGVGGDLRFEAAASAASAGGGVPLLTGVVHADGRSGGEGAAAAGPTAALRESSFGGEKESSLGGEKDGALSSPSQFEPGWVEQRQPLFAFDDQGRTLASARSSGVRKGSSGGSIHGGLAGDGGGMGGSPDQRILLGAAGAAGSVPGEHEPDEEVDGQVDWEEEEEEEEAVRHAGGWWRSALGTCREAMRPRVLSRFLRLGVPGGLSMSFEAGCFDFSTVLAGRLGATATAAHAAMLSVVTLTYLACPFALATAGSIRVGNLLGAGQPDGARRAGVLAVFLSGGFMAVMAVTLLACRGVLGYMFTTDPRVIRVIRELAVFAALFQVSDGLMGSSQGVLRGCGHQHLTAVFNFTGFWVCGVLLGYLLCFKVHLGIHGLWAGISSGDTATCLLNLVAMARIRWDREADKAVARIKALAEQAEEEQAMLPAACRPSSEAGGSSDGGHPGKGASAAAAAAGGAAIDGTSPVIGGGGRSYAGGLKRMWSERRVSEAVSEARRQRQLVLRQDSATARLFRSLSSFFRRQPPGTAVPVALAEVQVTGHAEGQAAQAWDAPRV